MNFFDMAYWWCLYCFPFAMVVGMAGVSANIDDKYLLPVLMTMLGLPWAFYVVRIVFA